MNQKFSEFNEFRESEKSLKHKLGKNLKILSVSSWRCGNNLVSNTRDGRFEPYCCNHKYFVTKFGEFNENIKGKLNC